MEEVNEVVDLAVNGQGSSNALIMLILILVAIVFVAENVKKFVEIFGIKNKWSIHEEEQAAQMKILKEEIDALNLEINALKEVYKKRDDKCTVFENDVGSVLKEIKNELIHSQVDEARYRILDFASAITKRNYSREYFDHILEKISTYEELCDKYHIINSKADMAISFIKQKYQEYQANGFPVY